MSEVLKLHVTDVDDQKLTIRNPKSGKSSEAVFISKKLADRLKDYIRARGMEGNLLPLPRFQPLPLVRSLLGLFWPLDY